MSSKPVFSGCLNCQQVRKHSTDSKILYLTDGRNTDFRDYPFENGRIEDIRLKINDEIRASQASELKGREEFVLEGFSNFLKLHEELEILKDHTFGLISNRPF